MEDSPTPTPFHPSKFPRSLFFILPAETAERFSYSGIKAILPLFLTQQLGLSEDNAASLVHTFIALAYSVSVFGGWVADTHWGKHVTIRRLLVVYFVGTLVLTVAAAVAKRSLYGPVVGLALVALGTGGIKPCVTSFVGDQLVIPGQEKLLIKVFSRFYLAISIGSLMSAFLSPLLHKYSTYAAAFGLSSAAIGLAAVAFIVGAPRYRVLPPSGENLVPVIIRMSFCALRARRAARRSREELQREPRVHLPLELQGADSVSSAPRSETVQYYERDHWLDYSKGQFDPDLVEGAKLVFSVFRVFSVLPVWWFLFEQHASRWVFQAQQMDRHMFGGSFELTPDQMPVFSPLLVILLVPLLHRAVLPALASRGVRFLPLHRIAVGLLLTAGSSLAACLVQLHIDSYLAHAASLGPAARPSVWLQMPQLVLLALGEVLVAITALEFAYTQSPPFLKGLVLASWQATTALGNIMVVAASQSRVPMSIEFGAMAVMMIFALLAFLFLSRDFKYVTKFTFRYKDLDAWGFLEGEGLMGVR